MSRRTLREHVERALGATSADALDVSIASRSGLERLAYAVAGPAWHDLGGHIHRVPLPTAGGIMPWWPNAERLSRRARRLVALVPRAQGYARGAAETTPREVAS